MLKTASKLIHNWRCYPSSKCCKIDQKHGFELGVLLWRHLTPHRDIGAQQLHRKCSGREFQVFTFRQAKECALTLF